MNDEQHNKADQASSRQQAAQDEEVQKFSSSQVVAVIEKSE
jgi:hypothetical protein